MKRFVLVSLVLLPLITAPVRAQFFRRPAVQNFIRSPFARELLEFGVSQIPGVPPHILSGLPSLSNASVNVTVDASVAKRIQDSKTSLDSARDILDDIIEEQAKRAEEAKAAKEKEEKERKEAEKKGQGEEILVPEASPVDPKKKKVLNDELSKWLKLLDSPNEKVAAQAAQEVVKLADQVAKNAGKKNQYRDLLSEADIAVQKGQYTEAMMKLREARNMFPQDQQVMKRIADLAPLAQGQEFLDAIKAIGTELGGLRKPANVMEDIMVQAEITIPKSAKGHSVTIFLKRPAPEDLKIKVSTASYPEKVLSGSGIIKKKMTSGVVIVNTNDAPELITSVIVQMNGVEAGTADTLRVKIK